MCRRVRESSSPEILQAGAVKGLRKVCRSDFGESQRGANYKKSIRDRTKAKRQTDRQTETERQRETETDRDRHRHRDTETETERQRQETETERAVSPRFELGIADMGVRSADH